jgi:hypothetical protein
MSGTLQSQMCPHGQELEWLTSIERCNRESLRHVNADKAKASCLSTFIDINRGLECLIVFLTLSVLYSLQYSWKLHSISSRDPFHYFRAWVHVRKSTLTQVILRKSPWAILSKTMDCSSIVRFGREGPMPGRSYSQDSTNQLSRTRL